MKKRDLVQFSDIPLPTANFGKLRKVVGFSVGQSEVDDFTEVVYRWPRYQRFLCYDAFDRKKCRRSSNMGKVDECKASYYCNDSKTWVYGHLVIYTRCIRFIEDKGGTSGLDFRIYFEDFFELKKETTSIFFAAITVRLRTDKYWFSSFGDRGHVFNTIEHFWKERLFARYVERRIFELIK